MVIASTASTTIIAITAINNFDDLKEDPKINYQYYITEANKIIAQCLVTLLWKKRKEISKYIINDRVNSENIDEILNEFICTYNGIYPSNVHYIGIKYNKDKLSISPMLYEEIKEYADNNLLANAKLFMVVQCPKVDEYADLQRNDFVVHKGFVEYENN